MNKLKLGQRGFTIVELLIVIVIIGILATIGFVAFSGAQNRARKSNAEATVSQIKSKLGEYNAEEDSYPADKAAVLTFLRSAEGGNNDSLADKVDTGGELVSITYTCTEGGGDDPCTAFSLTAPGAIWGASDESFTVTN